MLNHPHSPRTTRPLAYGSALRVLMPRPTRPLGGLCCGFRYVLIAPWLAIPADPAPAANGGRNPRSTWNGNRSQTMTEAIIITTITIEAVLYALIKAGWC